MSYGDFLYLPLLYVSKTDRSRPPQVDVTNIKEVKTMRSFEGKYVITSPHK